MCALLNGFSGSLSVLWVGLHCDLGIHERTAFAEQDVECCLDIAVHSNQPSASRRRDRLASPAGSSKKSEAIRRSVSKVPLDMWEPCQTADSLGLSDAIGSFAAFPLPVLSQALLSLQLLARDVEVNESSMREDVGSSQATRGVAFGLGATSS
jgi:hypothetical protein